MLAFRDALKRTVATHPARVNLFRQLSTLGGNPWEVNVENILDSASLANAKDGEIVRIEGKDKVAFDRDEAEVGDYLKIYSGIRKRNAKIHSLDDNSIELELL